jgi:UDP-N-acetylglucosamine 1-carboxyvinyltransferase
MDKFIIEGGHSLKGEIKVSGSKNSTLPIMAASLLTKDDVVLNNVPNLRDINTMIKLLIELGCKVERKEDALKINCGQVNSTTAPYELVKTMRASILVLGPLVARFKYAKVSMPGGCAIGVRPVNLHIKALEALGAKIALENGYITAQTKSLEGSDIYFDTPTVTGTENIIMAAVLSKSKTIIKNAAREPEVVDLANMLITMGANINGAGTSTIVIEGTDELKGTSYTVMNDRIEAGTFMCTALATSSYLTIKNVPIYAMDAIFGKFKSMGGSIEKIDESTIIAGGNQINPINIKTSIYPGFPTDMQAQFMSVLSIANGTSIIEETIFENRFQHAAELNRMNANILASGSKAIIKGTKKLIGAKVMATDLRASASLVIAGLSADGNTEISRIYHLDRGYEQLEKKLSKVGAKIRRVKE